METVMDPSCLSPTLDCNLELDLSLPAMPATTELDRVGFDIGWDHAHHGLVPPPELLLEGTPLGQGWRAGRAVFGHRTLGTQRHTRQCLALRTLAWRQGVTFETQAVTAHYLAQLQVERCPVTRQILGGACGQAGESTTAQVDRLNPEAGYAAGNLAVISQAAAQARQGVEILELMRRAHRAHAEQAPVAGLDSAAWWRLVALRSFSTPLPFHQAARLPLAMLPPNRVRLLNAPQGLQALLTMQFTQPGWAARTRAIGALLPAHTLRHDFNLFIGALAPRVLEAIAARTDMRHALEDAWLQERVQRRWTHLLLSMGEAVTTALLDRAAELGLSGVVTLNLPPEQAVDGWALAQGGMLSRRGAWVTPQLQPPPQRTLSPHWRAGAAPMLLA
jgi:hypothetical protein